MLANQRIERGCMHIELRKVVSCVYASSANRGSVAAAPSVVGSDAYCLALGRAVAEWQFIESGLSNLFYAVTGSTNEAVSAAVFHVPSGFSTRLQMVTAAMKHAGVPHSWLARWEEIAKKIKKLSERRNVISHGITVFDMSRPEPDRFFLTTNINHPEKREDVFDHQTGVAANDLLEMARMFLNAREELSAFSNYFFSEVRGGFPNGDELPPMARGVFPEA
jgi:hypothetical protein